MYIFTQNEVPNRSGVKIFVQTIDQDELDVRLELKILQTR